MSRLNGLDISFWSMFLLSKRAVIDARIYSLECFPFQVSRNMMPSHIRVRYINNNNVISGSPNVGGQRVRSPSPQRGLLGSDAIQPGVYENFKPG